MRHTGVILGCVLTILFYGPSSACGRIAEWNLSDASRRSEYIVVGEVAKVSHRPRVLEAVGFTSKTTVTVEQVVKGGLTANEIVIDHGAYNRKYRRNVCALSLQFKVGERYILFMNDQFEVLTFYKGAVKIVEQRDTNVLALRHSVHYEDLCLYLAAVKQLMQVPREIGQAETNKLFVDLLSDDNVFLRRAAFEFPYWSKYWTSRHTDFSGKSELRSLLLKALEDTDPTVRYKAINQFRFYFASPDNEAIFISKLDDSEAWVRLKAARTLGKLGLSSSVPALMSAIQKHGREDVYKNDVQAMSDALREIRGY